MKLKSEILREEIINIATEEFLRNGFRNTSLRKIAKKANKTTGAIYTYFESKEDIFVEIIGKQFFGFLGKIHKDKFKQLSLENKLIQLVDYMFQPMKDIVAQYGVNRTMDFLVVSAELARAESLKQKNRELDLQTVELIREILKSEVINKTIDIDILAMQIVLIIDGALLNSMFLFDSLDEAEENCKKVILQTLKLIK